MEAPTLEQKVDTLTALVTELVEQNRRQQELLSEIGPIGKEVMAWATQRLDKLEQEGWFEMGRELVGILEALVETYEPEDVRQLGASAVTIVDAVRAITQPEVMALVAEAGEALQHGDELEPKSPWEMLQASRDPDVQRGMAVMMEVLRQVGKGTSELRPSDADMQRSRRERLLNKRTAPRGVRRTTYVAPVVEAPPPPVAAETLSLDGWTLDSDGFLADPSQWTEAFAGEMAAALGIDELTELHWKVVRFARNDWEKSGASPNIRRITLGADVSTKDMYGLWPQAPGKTTARVAGLPKPVGCL